LASSQPSNLSEHQHDKSQAIGKQDPPEVQGVAWPQFGRTGAAAPQADPSHQFVKETSQPPKAVREVPARVAPDGPDSVQRIADAACHANPLLVQQAAVFGNQNIATDVG